MPGPPAAAVSLPAASARPTWPRSAQDQQTGHDACLSIADYPGGEPRVAAAPHWLPPIRIGKIPRRRSCAARSQSFARGRQFSFVTYFLRIKMALRVSIERPGAVGDEGD